jgi:hypothetical protein
LTNTNRMTRDAAIATAVELRLPAPVLSLAQGIPLPAPLDLFFGTAEEFYLSPPEAQAFLGAPTLLPLWDDGNFDTITAIHLPTKHFLCFSIERHTPPDEHPRLSYQQALVQPFVRMWESELVDDRFNEIAELFAFKFSEEIRASSANAERDHEKWLAGLMHAAA